MDEGQLPRGAGGIRHALEFQFDIAWQLLEYHLNGLDDEECLWRPAGSGLHVHRESGKWRADWPEKETYDIGPASMAWTTWHILYWWSMALDHTFGGGTLTREDVRWPGSVRAAKEQIDRLREKWKQSLVTLPDEDYYSCGKTRWPFAGRPFYELAGWLNLELMKNAAEIGYCRFLYAARRQQTGIPMPHEG